MKENILTADKAPSRARKIVAIGDILYSTVRPYLHNMCIVDKEFSCEPIASTGFAVLTTYADYNNEYLFFYMLSPDFDMYANCNENSKGVAYPAINDERLSKALIPIPPLAEQKKIINYIRLLLPQIEKYKIKEEKLTQLNTDFPEKLKKSVLQMAIQGKLVEQNPSDEPAKMLLQAIKNEKDTLIKAGKIKKDKNESIIYRRDNSYYEKIGHEERCIDDEIPFDIPKSWEWVRVSNIGTMIRGSGIKRTETVKEGYPCVRYGELYTTYNISFDKTVSFIPKEIDVKCKHISKGDILFTLTGENKTDIAKAVVFQGEGSVAVGGDLGYWTSHNMNPYYLVYYMACPYAISCKRKTATGDIIVHISTSKVGNFLLPIPPLSEQNRIVNAIESVFEIINKYSLLTNQ